MIVRLEADHGGKPATYWSVVARGAMFQPRAYLCRTRQEARELRSELQARAVAVSYEVVRLRVRLEVVR